MVRRVYFLAGGPARRGNDERDYREKKEKNREKTRERKCRRIIKK